MTSRYQSHLAEAHAVRDELKRRNAERVVRAKAESQFLREMEVRHSDPSGTYRAGAAFNGASSLSSTARGRSLTPRRQYGSGGGASRGASAAAAEMMMIAPSPSAPHPRPYGAAVAEDHGAAVYDDGADEDLMASVGQPIDRLDAIHEVVAADHDRRIIEREMAASAARSRSRQRAAHLQQYGHQHSVVVAEGERFVEFTSRVEGCLAFCVCESQGGASVWTANTDGTLTIRNGTTLAAVVEIPRRADGATPSVFYSTRDGYVWVGYTDGTVQIYDGNVFVLITEGQFHNDEVTCFVQMHDCRVVSGSRDGSLVRWDNAERNFEAMSRVVLSDAAMATASVMDTFGRRRPQNEGVSCLATQGYEVFVGCSFTGHLVSIHAQEEIELGVFREHHSEGADCTCLAVADGYLFSGYASQRVFVWNIESRRCLHSVNLHAIPVTITADFPNAPVNYSTTTNRLWITLADATVQVWSTLADERFNADLAITAFSAAAPGTEMLSLQTATSWESMRAVSIGSNGVSKVWVSLNSQGRKARIDTIDNLSSVLKHDAVQLERIGATVQLFRQRQERRVAHLADLMLRARRDAMLREFYFKWQAVVMQRSNERNLAATTAGLQMLVPMQSLIFQYMSKWYRWMSQRRKANNTKKYALTLKPVQQERVHLLFLHRLKQFHAVMRSHKNLETIMKMFVKNSNENLLRGYYVKWTEYLRRRHRNRRLAAVADALQVSTSLTFLRRFYAQWYRYYAQRTYLLKLSGQMMLAADRMNAINAMRAYYNKLALYAKRSKALRQLSFLARQSEQQQLLRVYYQKWVRYLHLSAEVKVRHRLEDRRAYLERLRAENSELEALVAKKIAYDKLRAEIDGVDDEIGKVQSGYDEAVDTIGRLQQELEALRQQKQLSADNESTQEQLFKLMARLKAKALNFYSDIQLFNQVRERLKSGGQQIIVRHFLESHQSVKRVVVDITKRPHLGPTEKWPLSPAMIERLPSHHLTPIHNAIKVMVLCFDIMTRETRDSMQTDQEIVLNGEHLMSMIDVCVAHRKRLLRSVSGGVGSSGARSTTPAARAATPGRR